MITYWHIIRQNRLWLHNRNTSITTMNAGNICGKILQQRSRLSWHKRTHHTARCYSCGNCTKQYRRKEDLAKHAKKYDGIPPATDDAFSVTPPAVNTPKGSPTSYTIVSLYDTWFENMGEQVRNFHHILIIMNDGYVLRQFDVITEKVTQVTTQNTIYWIQNNRIWFTALSKSYTKAI